MEKRNGNWIQTNKGIAFYPLDPRPEEIDIDDISHALSNTCRFTGHCSEFYSVAQHSCLVAEYLPKDLKLIGLLHDASEAYLNDIATPVKKHLDYYRVIEKNLQLSIYDKFGVKDLYLAHKDEIDIVDKTMLATEKRDLMKKGLDWGLISNIVPYEKVVIPLSPKKSYELFLNKFNEYHGNNK